ncbi:dUTP diphosphatase [Sporosarcina sp. FA9]|uniref:dUTP diphosphatase n=1 Tax=Sporosarcina sp. FA9 TaxID=3413030 RepID=UPI003F655C85
MNLTKLFETQKVLRKKILEKHKLQHQNLLGNHILSLRVELGEMANEWQGFKHWKENPQPKVGLLEEFADNLSFLLEIGLEIDVNEELIVFQYRQPNPSLTQQFNEVFDNITRFSRATNSNRYVELGWYIELFQSYLSLGQALNFTLGQIERAYYAKSKINHTRQDNGY